MAIDGLSSGLDTNAIVTALMDIERAPVTMMTTRKTAAQAAVDAYKSIQTKMSAIATASGELERSSGWKLRVATSTNPTIAAVAATSGADMSALEFTVERLAATHGVATSSTTAATSDVVSSSGTIALTVGSTVHNISVGGGSLAEVASAINAAGVGVRATTVNTGSGFRLQLNATSSGQAAVFSVTSGLNLATAVTTQGVDAQLKIGTGPGAYTVNSATNTFSNVLAGVSITAKSVSPEVVKAEVTSDAEGLATKIQALVDAVNGALTEIKTRTAYDPTSKTAASLAGDAAARRAAQSLTSAISSAIGQSTLGSPGMAGVSLDRFGKATFDKSKFMSAYASDPAAVERLFVQGATTTGAVSFVSAGSRAVPGSRNVVVTQSATQAMSLGMVGTLPLTNPATIRIKVGSTEVVYSALTGATDVDVVAGLQAAVNGAGLKLDVTASGGGIQVKSSNYGTVGVFDVDWGGGSYATAPAVDAAGTIDGIAATGNGRQLSIPSTDGTLSGLSVLLTSNATGAVGTVNYEPGLAQRLSTAVVAATDVSSGFLVNASAGRKSRVDLFATSITQYEARLTIREARLRAEFSRLEVTLNGLQAQGSQLTAAFGSSSSSKSSS